MANYVNKKRPGGAMIGNSVPRWSELVPIVTKWPQLHKRAYLWPMIITVGFVVAMLATSDNEPIAYFMLHGVGAYPPPVYVSSFMLLVGVYLSLAIYYFIYRLCRRQKPWWVLVGVGVFSAVFLVTPLRTPFFWIFRGFLPGDVPPPAQWGTIPFPILFFQLIFGAGLMEELMKAIPVLALFWMARTLKAPWRERLGVCDPLDGILIGAASGLGFALMETYAQYVSQAILGRVPELAVAIAAALEKGETLEQVIHELSIGSLSGVSHGMQMLLPRVLGEAFGHSAYSGYFGYFIGLAALKPIKQWWKLFAVGWGSSAIIHALWDAFQKYDSQAANLMLGVAAYALLAAAIMKARDLSIVPLTPSSTLAVQNGLKGIGAGAPWVPATTAPVQTPRIRRAAMPLPPAQSLWLMVGRESIRVFAGVKLLEGQIPCLKAQAADGIVAEFNLNPQDDAISLHPFPQKCCERYAANPTPCQLSAHFPVANRQLSARTVKAPRPCCRVCHIK